MHYSEGTAMSRPCNFTSESCRWQGVIINFNEFRLSVGEITEVELQKLKELLKRKPNYFSSGEGELGLTHSGERRVQLMKDVPVYYRPYRLSYSKREHVHNKVKTLLNSGVIREYNSDYASPIVIVTKKGGGVRMCVGYRALNAITVKNRSFAVDRGSVKSAGEKMLFHCIGLGTGHQVPMYLKSVYKTVYPRSAIQVPYGSLWIGK